MTVERASGLRQASMTRLIIRESGEALHVTASFIQLSWSRATRSLLSLHHSTYIFGTPVATEKIVTPGRGS